MDTMRSDELKPLGGRLNVHIREDNDWFFFAGPDFVDLQESEIAPLTPILVDRVRKRRYLRLAIRRRLIEMQATNEPNLRRLRNMFLRMLMRDYLAELRDFPFRVVWHKQR